MDQIKDSNQLENPRELMRKISLLIEEKELLEDTIKSLEAELEDLQITHVNTMEHSSAIEDELEEKIEKLTQKKLKFIPESDMHEELKTKLSLELEKNEHLKRQNENLMNQLEQLRFLYVNTMDHSSTLENELNEKYREASRLSMTDSLTNIFNREGYIKNWEREVERVHRQGGTFSIVLFDIDNFKRVNDNYGHDVGDMVLTKTVNVIQETIRKGDTLARWGGEEFLIIFPGLSSSEMKILAERLRCVVETTQFAGPEQITCSFGLTEFVDGDSVDTMIKRADTALYSAKKNGRNCVEVG